MNLLLTDAQVALIVAQTAVMNCRVAGMVARNQYYKHHKSQPQYDQVDFDEVEREFHHVLGLDSIIEMSQRNS